jgi:hypothetical protein
MKKYILLAAIGLVFAAPVAWGQSDTGAPPQGSSPPMGNMNGTGGMQPMGGQGDGMKFEERKADILKHINQHLAETEQRKSCVEAAQNHDALRACMPERRSPGGGAPENSQGGSAGQH